jgi:hypothetical protein
MASYRFTMVENSAALRDHLGALEDLSATALEPNPFYEPWMLLPAIEAFGAGVQIHLVLAYAEQRSAGAKLCGLFPLERVARFKGLPFRHVRLWRYPHRYLGTPLVRQGHARACLEEFLAWLGESGDASMIEWSGIGNDGAFHAALSAALRATGRRSFVGHAATRALLRPHHDGEAYLHRSLPGASRKEFRRLERRLAEKGGLRYQTLSPEAPADAWIEEFLALEARGWKGQRGTAQAIDIAKRMRCIVRQNLCWSAAYNFGSLPLAALGFIPPWLAAIGMSLSSMLVVLNATRLLPRQPRAAKS